MSRWFYLLMLGVVHVRVSSRARMVRIIRRTDPFQTRGAPCFEPPATDEDWQFLHGNDPEEAYQP